MNKSNQIKKCTCTLTSVAKIIFLSWHAHAHHILLVDLIDEYWTNVDFLGHKSTSSKLMLVWWLPHSSLLIMN